MVLAGIGLVLVFWAYALGFLNPIVDYFSPNPGKPFNTVGQKIREGVWGGS